MEDQGCQRKCKENISVLLYLWQTDMTNKRRMFCDWFANIALTHWRYKLISIMTTTREQCKLAGQSYILKFTRRSNDFNDSLTGKKACWSCSGRSFYNWGVQQIVFKREVGAAPLVAGEERSLHSGLYAQQFQNALWSQTFWTV